ncbi:MFS transporter [Rickettsia rickettsii str. 'Sheila Smith']|uniref:Major facilitator superfamily (MFS) profile domain-containing protein n=2 Tax=Rickettsia rickettsii TaxID=783 RepID=B0BV63_RICRO|nr:MFS transporter [Rickettsia rickettsii]ABY73123.1 hypothetical protein RrIowa_1389 [Rickettsia rickettsii str. Iowa]APU56073.1 hypothetical protein BTU50_1389 [Rickettsia rickettsii]APU57450.1 hypothetical protein BTU51_1389 [Rickettsia rickettsii]USD85271.1 MFS transporter [Rickettsia rickettsii]USD86596.1 MFS transporter [Rickettsia rickettsii]
MIAISVWGIMATVGAAIGPVLGGVLVELLSWQFAFFNKNAPIALVIIVFGIVWIPKSSNPSNEPMGLDRSISIVFWDGSFSSRH